MKSYSKVVKLFLLISITFWIMCDSSDKPKVEAANQYNDVSHPTEINIPKNGLSTTYVEENLGDIVSFINNSPKLVLGKEEMLSNSNDSDIFGKIGGVVKISESYVVLDTKFNEIRTYTLNGAHIESYKLSGRGPGEFLRPKKLISYGNLVIVLDVYNKAIIYEFKNEKLIFRDEIITDFSPEDMCVMGEDLIIRGIKANKDEPEKLEGTILHSYSLKTGEYNNSFGPAYISTNWLTVNQLSDGPVVCIQDKELVLFAYEYLPYLYAINLEGDVQWVYDFSDKFYKNSITEMYEGGRPAIEFGASGDEYFEQITNINYFSAKELVLVQNSVLLRENSSQKVRTIIVDPFSKKSYADSFEFPVIHSIMESNIISSNSKPYPTIEVYED